MKRTLLSLCLVFTLIGCKSGEYWDLLVHMQSNNVVETFSIEGFDTKKDCEKAGQEQYKDAILLCVKRQLTF